MSPSPARDRIHSSPALGVSAHTPIGDCVRLMRDRSVGSLLIMSHQDPGQLVGIFTERDLLKWVDEIQHGGHWEKPVAHLMSKPVVTLPISRFDEAAALMIEKRFRHLPIIYDEPANRGQIAGVISMRDLLAMELKGLSGGQKRKRRQKVVFFCDRSPARKQESQSLSKWAQVHWQTRVLAAPPTPAEYDELETADLLIVDLDGLVPGTWGALIKELSRREQAPPMILLFSEREHPPEAVKLLKQFSRSGKLPAFAKPLSLVDFLASVHEALGD